MRNKEFILRRIGIFAGEEIDPTSDDEVRSTLQNKFNVLLPQRRSFDDSLRDTASEHEIIQLILEYRVLK